VEGSARNACSAEVSRSRGIHRAYIVGVVWVPFGSRWVPSNPRRSAKRVAGGWSGSPHDRGLETSMSVPLLTPFDDLEPRAVLRPQEVADRMRVDVRSIRRAITAGALPASRACGLRVLATDAATWWRSASARSVPHSPERPPPNPAGEPKPRKTARRSDRSSQRQEVPDGASSQTSGRGCPERAAAGRHRRAGLHGSLARTRWDEAAPSTRCKMRWTSGPDARRRSVGVRKSSDRSGRAADT